MNLSLRYSFNVPTFAGKKQMLSGFRLQHVVLHDAIEAAEFFGNDLYKEFGGDVNKLAKIFMPNMLRRVQRQFQLTDEQMTHVSFRGLSTTQNEPGTKLDPCDSRWV